MATARCPLSTGARIALVTLLGLELVGGLLFTVLLAAVAGMGALAADAPADTEAAERAQLWIPLLGLGGALLMVAAMYIAWHGVRGERPMRAAQRVILVLVLGLHLLGTQLPFAFGEPPIPADFGDLARIGALLLVMAGVAVGVLRLLLERRDSDPALALLTRGIQSPRSRTFVALQRALMTGALVASVMMAGVACAQLSGSRPLAMLEKEKPGPVEVESDLSTVRAKLGQLVPCRESDPGSGCDSGPLYPLRARGRLRIRSETSLEIDAGARADHVSAWLGRYRGRTNYPRGNYRGTYYDKGEFVRLARIGRPSRRGRRWTFRVPDRLNSPERLNIGVDYANATRKRANFEVRVCVSPCQGRGEREETSSG